MINASRVAKSEWNFTVGKGAGLFTKLSEMPVKLGNIAYIFVGLQTSADTVFLFKDTQQTNSSTIRVYSKELDQDVEIETGLLKPVIRSGEIGRYWASPSALVLFPYETKNSKSKLKTESDLQKEYPKTWDYLLANKKLLSEREHGKFLILADFVVVAKVRHDRLKLHHEPSQHASKTVYQNQSQCYKPLQAYHLTNWAGRI